MPTESEAGASTALPAGPIPAFSLPYRMIYAVATQDAIHIYDTQQQKPLCVVSNLHFATFTDITWYVQSTPETFIPIANARTGPMMGRRYL
jgi:chromatin assembly factor 1 subunit B